jgi:hypothetical protein
MLQGLPANPAQAFCIFCAYKQARETKARTAVAAIGGWSRAVIGKGFRMWTRAIDARIAKLIPDLETGFGVRFPKVPWLDEGHQGTIRTIDVSYSKAEETSGIVRHSPIGQVFVRLLPSGDLNITEKPIPGHETLIGEISARIGAVLRR